MHSNVTYSFFYGVSGFEERTQTFVLTTSLTTAPEIPKPAARRAYVDILPFHPVALLAIGSSRHRSVWFVSGFPERLRSCSLERKTIFAPQIPKHPMMHVMRQASFSDFLGLTYQRSPKLKDIL